MPEKRDVEINYRGQKILGCNGLLLLAKDAEEMNTEMSQLAETTQVMKQEITEVNHCVKSIDEHLKNGKGRNLKRDAAVVGGGGALVGLIVYAKDLFEAIITALGGG